ncbi:2-hydroxy-3-oxopropionate reductase [Halobacillus sp. BAB-2008]|uniref:2-hydroxy-3-oxopropionate reductase n=1 Tax=Halobacillus sp. BAB-2008 TaxID=1246484 RepID=UPI002404EFB7|nr:2-hydroxy-3-oxopropionate reductase [Halobacillus sp. BAB-2008]
MTKRRDSTMKIGFIGLGIMGKPMAGHLVAHGHTVKAFDLNQKATEALAAQGAIACTSSKDAAYESDVIITMLPKAAHVESALFAENGVVEGAKPGAIVIDMSSISPVETKKIAAELKTHHLRMMDAPVSGGEPKAVDGTLAIMAGGEEEAFQEVLPLLECMGTNIVLVGAVGSGTTAKLANQVMVNVNIAAMSEAFILAAKAGIDLPKMYEAIRSGLAGSAVLDAKAPLIFERNFVAGGRIDINAKDLTNVLNTAKELEVDMPLSDRVLSMFNELITDGKASDDHGGLIQYYEKTAGTKVAAPVFEGK